MRDPYSVLGVKPTASPDEIKAAWRMLAKALHPDRNSRDPNAHVRFAEVGQAYQLLKDPDKRQRFDQERRMAEEARRREQASGGARRAESPPKAEDAEGDIFSSLWRKMAGQPNTPDKAPDLTVDVQISIEDIFEKTKPLVQLPDGRTLRVTLPEGVMDGKQVRIAAQGHRLAGLKRGDVVATFRIAPHPVFRADGLDLYTSVPVDIENAVLGCETIVDAPDGMVRVTVPEWSGSDRTLRIRGRGLPGRDDVRGDLYAEIRVMLWDHPDDKVKDLMRSLREGLFL
ncbi:DnaJ C-terminal domain-containing protein [Rhizobium sp. C1]|uniref:DnaJ C-terminal domain-containing protein n=1 Tax=Rhizobium sp. C1 TaxID=1349799 RepID=UPI001E49E8D6|nr:DnaJ C-terminal domain-containing protein [Rhizobium sp. C1]MCD2179667.1 DnaJ domain-containing protein [Rhizobium sp. C1]